MARFKRLEVFNTIVNTGLVPIFYYPQLDVAESVIQACAEGGSRIVELTNRGDGACRLFGQLADFCQRELPEMILGAGTILDAPTAALFIDAGANFIVGPAFNPEVARMCNRRKIAYIPGCASASEISTAEELGSEIVKIFPANTLGGPDFVKALLGPCPWTSIMATGGVEDTRECLETWFKAGVTCVGMGSNLIPSKQVAAGEFQTITARVKKVIKWIVELKQMNSEAAGTVPRLL
jgi:2-dehydro-3-deoxyphosphogluconate aldolase / (4S)-4-hydroxy-2-oxoglutarate aldolase